MTAAAPDQARVSRRRFVNCFADDPIVTSAASIIAALKLDAPIMPASDDRSHGRRNASKNQTSPYLRLPLKTHSSVTALQASRLSNDLIASILTQSESALPAVQPDLATAACAARLPSN